ncbi:hypothetical protein OsI_17819 [Oryza sativa Indica Group]|uniref:DM2 domain-containing protein n=1 Tax=Oryza sativa subsp. indica TaxID=39946 RepID=B8AVZ4_ORYSI|nr:hypothetical protein OsI_17819 [Oryza sativa Indica Group]
MVSDQEIASCVESVLRSSGGAAGEASLAAVLSQAEAKLGVDLAHKATFIRDQMDLFFGPRLQPPLVAKAQAAAAAAPNPPPLSPLPRLPCRRCRCRRSCSRCSSSSRCSSPSSYSSPCRSSPLVYQAAPLGRSPRSLPCRPWRSTRRLLWPSASPAAWLGSPLVGPSPSSSQPVEPAALLPPPSAVQVRGRQSRNSASKRKRGGPGGLNKVCAISPELQTIVGETVMSRTQIVKQLWQYIRQNNLQDPDDKRKIICNDELRVVFGTDTTDMFKMNKLLAKHITPLDPKDQIREAKKFKPSNVATQPMPLINQPSVVISDALAKFIGMEGTVPQDDALRYLWDYIKANQLEDAITGSILCDSKLQELFGCESIPSSGLSELLAHHFIKET